MKRPLTIWFTQSLLIIFALLFLSAFLFNLVVLLTHLDQQEFSLIPATIGFSITLAFFVLLIVAFWGLAKRARYGRWLGVLSLIIVWGLIILGKVSRPSGPLQYYEYDNNTQLAGAIIVQVLLHGLILILILRLSFSKKIAAFFVKKVESS